MKRRVLDEIKKAKELIIWDDADDLLIIDGEIKASMKDGKRDKKKTI